MSRTRFLQTASKPDSQPDRQRRGLGGVATIDSERAAEVPWIATLVEEETQRSEEGGGEEEAGRRVDCDIHDGSPPLLGFVHGNVECCRFGD